MGSLDPNSPYRMLITLSNRGASITRVELNESAYEDNIDSSGYLGQIIVDESLANDESHAGLPGVSVQAAGAGTPVALAGLNVGDRIVSFTDANGVTTKINEMLDLRDVLLKTKPGDKVALGIYEADRLQTSSSYRTTSMITTNYYMNRASKPSDEMVFADVAENVTPDSNDESVETTEQDSAAEGVENGVKSEEVEGSEQRGTQMF